MTGGRCCPLWGEEFSIILPATTNVGAARIAESIQQAVQ